MTDYNCSLAELIINACAEAWRDDGELMATGIGPLPRLGASLAKVSFNPLLQLTDGENYYADAPVPPGKRRAEPVYEGYANYDRVFSALWGGRRHSMVSPVQLDRFGQANISTIGDRAAPKVAMLGARGFPGNSIYHPNSFFIPNHSTRSFVADEVDFVCMAGYNPERYLKGTPPKGLDLRIIVSDLCVMDFNGPDKAIRVVSLHPGVSFELVQENTGFELSKASDTLPLTPAPTEAHMALIEILDPNNVRGSVLKDNPPAIRD